MIEGEWRKRLPHLTAFYGIKPWEAGMMTYEQMQHYLDVYDATMKEAEDLG